MTSKYEISAYYFPNYHVDARNEIVHRPEWTEWEVVKKAIPRYEGHVQPKQPLWGCGDEADPVVMAQKIEAASTHGITNWIFDWYWYDDGPFLQNCLEQGYLNAGNNDQVKFSLMWANHDWFDMHPQRVGQPYKLLYPGAVCEKTFETIIDYVIDKYMGHESYFKIDGACYFSFYELNTFVVGVGGMDNAARLIELFRCRAAKQGINVHLNAIDRGLEMMEEDGADANEVSKALGLDSVTAYVWVHHVRLPKFPTNPYRDISAKARQYWHAAAEKYSSPYFPIIGTGWDPSPRISPEDEFVDMGNFRHLVEGNTPQAFRENLRCVKDFLDNQSALPVKMFIINAWNEWTEGAYLEPDEESGYEFLTAVKDVFVQID